LGAGVGVASGLRAVMSAVGIDIPGGGVVVSTSTVVTGVVAGLGSASSPPCSPHARLRRSASRGDARPLSGEQRRSRRRAVTRVVAVTAAGAALMADGLFAESGIASVGLGAVA
jgi:putative ABC transport system permease protein